MYSLLIIISSFLLSMEKDVMSSPRRGNKSEEEDAEEADTSEEEDAVEEKDRSLLLNFLSIHLTELTNDVEYWSESLFNLFKRHVETYLILYPDKDNGYEEYHIFGKLYNLMTSKIDYDNCNAEQKKFFDYVCEKSKERENYMTIKSLREKNQDGYNDGNSYNVHTHNDNNNEHSV